MTYLDGVESREGVFIVAASSRPDLIDSAVLRPGRLDKMLNCDFPDKLERYDILKKYYDKSINVDSDDHYENLTIEKIKIEAYESLNEISDNTQFYTGADLQSLIYNSFLLAAKNNIEKNIDKHPIITKEDIINSFKNFKRSLTDKDIKFYNGIKENYLARTEGNKKQENKEDYFNKYEKRHDEILNQYKDDKMKTTLI